MSNPHLPGDKRTTFRLLCNAQTAADVIGSNDAVISLLRNQTHTTISIDKPLATSTDRLIHLTGDTSITNNLTLTENQPEQTIPVSNVQKALLIVFERMVELKRKGEREENCRLLVKGGQPAFVIGKGGCVVKAIENQTGANIKCFKEFEHPCALPGDEMIQITGKVYDVKKAIIAVSSRLQPFSPWDNERPDAIGNLKRAPVSRGVTFEDATNDHPLQLELDRDPNVDGTIVKRQVSFRLLCPYDTAGGVIGRNADVVKAMEKETGASIRFAAPVDTSSERVANIISLEKPDESCSPAQVAVLHVFTRSLEVKGMDERRSVEARVLVRPEEINCLIDDAGRISAGITLASDVEIQLLGADFAPSCAKENDIVVQLTGNFAHVKETLYQITGRLRERLFSTKVSDEEGCRQHPKPSNKSKNSNGRGSASYVLAESSIGNSPRAHDTLDLYSKFSAHPPRLPHEMFKARGDATKVENERDPITSEVQQSYGSTDAEAIGSVTMEMAFPEQAFGNVYGENGNNLARLKEISGATITVQDPCPGKSSGKVVISGTMERVEIAQSLLCAFILL